MGACSSKPDVLEDKGDVPPEPEPLPEVDQGTKEVTAVDKAGSTFVEAAENVVSDKEEIFQETSEDEPEEMATIESEAVVEQDAVEATPAAEELNNVEAPHESEACNKVMTPATDGESIEEKETVEPVEGHTNLPIEEAAPKDEEATYNPESPAPAPAPAPAGNPFQSFMSSVAKGWGWH